MKMTHDEYIAANKDKAIETAKYVLAHDDDWIGKIRELVAQLTAIGYSIDDNDYSCLLAIDSESDSLPIGQVREKWDACVLSEKDNEMREWGNQALPRIRIACTNIVSKISNKQIS
jgi:hypothetical protein